MSVGRCAHPSVIVRGAFGMFVWRSHLHPAVHTTALLVGIPSGDLGWLADSRPLVSLVRSTILDILLVASFPTPRSVGCCGLHGLASPGLLGRSLRTTEVERT